ncbi:MAG: 3-deoxy-8-phosphooctulonate synthase [Acidobacteriota bacterium]
MEIAPGIVLGGDEPTLPVILGPCAVEGHDAVLEAADAVASIVEALSGKTPTSDGSPLPAIFKASFDKANRSSVSSFRSIGLEPALEALAEVKETTGLPILTDVHEPGHCARVAEVADVLQIPAFLCRQTDLVQAAAETGRAINLKKGQFLAPDDVPKAIAKAHAVGNHRVFVTERGFSFGYHDLVVDFRAVPELQSFGVPVVFDATHALQKPGGGTETGGARRFAETLARAAVAAGCDGVFLEVHPDPPAAFSDSTTQLPPDRALRLLDSLLAVRAAVAPHLRADAEAIRSAGAPA